MTVIKEMLVTIATLVKYVTAVVVSTVVTVSHRNDNLTLQFLFFNAGPRGAGHVGAFHFLSANLSVGPVVQGFYR